MKVLVTGCNGYIGSVLTRKLLEKKGFEVWGIDTREPRSKDPRLRFTAMDIRTAPASFVGQFDIVFHLAAQADIVQSFKEPDYTKDVNLEGTKNLLKGFKGSRFVFASSSSVYSVTNPYAQSKLDAEAAIKDSGKPYTILRFFNVYGWGKQGLVVQEFLKNALEGKDVMIAGSGEQKRDFIHVDDITDAMITIATHPKAVDQTFDVGTGKATSVNELVTMIEGITKKTLKKKRSERRAGDLDVSLADLSRIKSTTGWVPKVSLKEGITRMVREHESQAKTA